MSTAATTAASISCARSARAARSSASSPLRSSELTVKLAPPMSNWLFNRLATMFGMVPRTAAASSGGPMPARAASTQSGEYPRSRARVAMRQRTPKRAASGSTPIPT